MIGWDDIRRAIGHPSGILPRLPGEPPSNWQARAVLHLLETAEAKATDGQEHGGLRDQIAGIIDLHPEMIEEDHVGQLADVIHVMAVRPEVRRLTRERNQLQAAIGRVRAVHHLIEWVSLSNVCHRHHWFSNVEPNAENIAVADVCADCKPRRYMDCVCAEDPCPVLTALDQPKET